MTPLHSACSRGCLSVVKELLELGGNVNVQASSRRSTIAGNFRCVKKYEIEASDDYMKNYDRQTPLHLACYRGHTEVIALLFEYGAEVNATDRAVSGFARREENVGPRRHGGRTALHWACYEGWHQIVKILLERGAKVIATDETGKAPIHLAGGRIQVRWNKPDRSRMVEALLARHADLNAKDFQGATPLHHASKEGHSAFAQLLMEKGAKVDSLDVKSRTPLHYACHKGHLDIAELLIQRGAKVSVSDKEGMEPLSLALAVGCINVCKALVKYHAASSLSTLVLSAGTGIGKSKMVKKIKTMSYYAIDDEWKKHGLFCRIKEKRIGHGGGRIELPSVILRVSPYSLSEPEILSVRELGYAHVRQEQFKRSGLHELQPGIMLWLEPDGQEFLRPVHLEIKHAQPVDDVQYLIFHKDVEDDDEAPWMDITNKCLKEVSKNTITLSLDHFCLVELVFALTGLTVGMNMRTSIAAILNNQCAPCTFYVYHRSTESCFVVVIEAQLEDRNARNQICKDSGSVYVGRGSSRCSLIDGEILLFYYNSRPDVQAEFPLQLERCLGNGQCIDVPLSSLSDQGMPKEIYVRRSLTSEEKLLGEINLNITTQPTTKFIPLTALPDNVNMSPNVINAPPLDTSDHGKRLEAQSYQSESREEKLERLKEYIQHGRTRRDRYITDHYATLVEKMRTTSGLLDVLVSQNVLTRREEASISALKTECEQSKCLIDIVSKVDHDKYLDFLEALARWQVDLVQFLTDEKWKKPGETC